MKEFVQEEAGAQRKNGDIDFLMAADDSEIASWIPYPLDDTELGRDFFADLLAEPKIQSPKHEALQFQNFSHFARVPARTAATKPESDPDPKSSTAVGSNTTPVIGVLSRTATTSATGSGSATSFTVAAEEFRRKRKACETADVDSLTVDNSSDVTEARKQIGGSRSRVAQVHNLSERRRRDRINEKMRALQQLIPWCTNKVDKASLLDEAIQYLKSLQLQVQMMSMNYGLVPTVMPPPPMPMMMPVPAVGPPYASPMMAMMPPPSSSMGMAQLQFPVMVPLCAQPATSLDSNAILTSSNP